MLKHFVTFLLLSAVGLRCLIAKPCARLYVHGVEASNYPQLAGVYVLQATSPMEVLFFSVVKTRTHAGHTRILSLWWGLFDLGEVHWVYVMNAEQEFSRTAADDVAFVALFFCSCPVIALW